MTGQPTKRIADVFTKEEWRDACEALNRKGRESGSVHVWDDLAYLAAPGKYVAGMMREAGFPELAGRAEAELPVTLLPEHATDHLVGQRSSGVQFVPAGQVPLDGMSRMLMVDDPDDVDGEAERRQALKLLGLDPDSPQVQRLLWKDAD